MVTCAWLVPLHLQPAGFGRYWAQSIRNGTTEETAATLHLTGCEQGETPTPLVRFN